MKKIILSALFVLITNLTLTGQAIRIRQIGQGQPMVFLPHIGCSSAMWEGIAQHFSSTHTCYLVDLAGFAGMPAVEGKPTPTYLQALGEWLVAQDLQNAIVVGQNYGGFLGAQLSLSHPERITHLIASDFYPALKWVLDSTMTDEKLANLQAGMRQSMLALDSASFSQYQTQMASGMNFADTAWIKPFVRWQDQSDREVLIETLCEQLSADLCPQLAHAPQKILAFSTWYFALNYKQMPIEAAPAALANMFRGLPQVQHAITADAKDFMPLDQPEWFISQVEKFLQQK